MSEPPSTPTTASAAMVAGALAGVLGGIATGLVDGLWSYSALGQYLPAFASKLRLLAHLALSYSLAAGLVGASLGLLVHLLRATQAPRLLRALCNGTRAKPASVSPREATISRLSLVCVGVPALAVTSAIAYLAAHQVLLYRKHAGLVIASSIAISLLALVLGSLATLLAARVVAIALSRFERLARRPRVFGLAIGMALVAACVGIAHSLFAVRMAGVPTSQLALLATALLSPLLASSFVPPLLSLVDGGRKRHLALPLVLCFLPLLGAALALAFRLASRDIGAPTALLIGEAMTLALLALVAAIVLAVALARLLEKPLQRFSARYAPLALALVMIATGVAIAGVRWWPTLRLLPLRPVSVAALLLTFGVLVRAKVPRLALQTPAWVMMLLAPLLFTGIILSGHSEAIQKAQGQQAGLSEPLAKLYRVLGDWDRDGSSRWLGGGDCDDSDPAVNPLADEIPYDGIDNNCLGGDVRERSLGATHFAPVPDGLPQDFNILFITVDTLRADHLGAYGYDRDTSPNIDALAADGTLFANGWAHAPSTRYSIPALLTGRYPLNVRYVPIPGQWPGLSLDNTTIAEIMKARGLLTGAILNYWYFERRRHMDQGFDSYDNSNSRLHHAVHGKGPAQTSGSSSKEQSDKAIEYIDSHENERFFLWVHYYDPHYDYEQHQDVPDFGSRDIDVYDNEIAFTDKHIGRVIRELKTRGLYKKTVIVLTGDHGEGFGEHGITHHGYHLYAAQTKVPFIIRVPGTRPARIEMPASHVDILPTLANLAGAPSTSEMMGRSLLGVISGTEEPDLDRYVFQQLSFENHNEYRGAVSRQCHILYNISPNRSWELYRIDVDPMETRDIINNPGPCAGARDALEAWYDYSEIPEGAAEALISEPPNLRSPLRVNFGDDIALLQLSLPASVRRGKAVKLHLLWKALGRPAKGWKVFMHFEMSPGQEPRRARFTSDHAPVRPFSWWRAEQFVSYNHTLSVPSNQAPGRYDLWFGIYKGSERMHVVAPGGQVVKDRVKLGTIEILR